MLVAARSLPQRVLLLLVLVALAVVGLALPAHAGTATVTTDDQQSVSQTAPNATDCGVWSPANGSTTAQKRIEVSFNTAGVVPAGNSLTAAVLRVFPRSNYSANNVSVKAYTRSGAINCNVTWSNLGTVGSQVAVSAGSFTKNVYKSITLPTSAINTSGRTAFVLDATAAQLMEFRSDASGSNLNPSKLDLTWAPTPTPPAVVTGAASSVTATGATLNGTVNPNSLATTYHFEYGTTTSYGTSIPVPDGSAGSGSSAVAKAEPIGGLSASTLYHFRLVATNSAGTTNGADASFTTSASGGCSGVTVLSTDDIAAVMGANAAGTTFCVQGYHRLGAKLVPEAGDVLWGEPGGATLDGSKVLSTWTPSGSNWWATRASGTTSSASTLGGDRCNPAPATACDNPNDLFRDEAPLVRVDSLGGLATGKFYEDFSANRVYVRDDPTGHNMEQATTDYAVQGTAANVTVKNFIVEEFATPAQVGAVRIDGSGWTVTQNELRYNHGYGVSANGPNALVTLNKLHHSMQQNSGGDGGADDLVFSYNELSYGNRDNSYQQGWEAGGAKWALMDRPRIQHNWSHHNHGMGLWFDINVGNGIMEDNYADHNDFGGLYHEISYGEVTPGDGLKSYIRNNVADANNANCTSGLWCGGQILVSASRDTEVYGNIVRGVDGIGGMAQDRSGEGADARGAYKLVNAHFYDNTIESTYVCCGAGWGNAAGIHTDDSTQTPSVWTSQGNTFESNDYYVPSSTYQHWTWRADLGTDFATWSQWQGYGNDDTAGGGTRTIGTIASFPSPPTLGAGPQ
jgi:hypothetical protein